MFLLHILCLNGKFAGTIYSFKHTHTQTHTRMRSVIQNVDRWIILRRKLDKTHYIHCLITASELGFSMMPVWFIVYVDVHNARKVGVCVTFHGVYTLTQVERRFMFQNKIIFTKYLQKVLEHKLEKQEWLPPHNVTYDFRVEINWKLRHKHERNPVWMCACESVY